MEESMLHELHESEISFQKEQTVLEQCEQLSSRLKEALQAHKQDRYIVLVLDNTILLLSLRTNGTPSTCHYTI